VQNVSDAVAVKYKTLEKPNCILFSVLHATTLIFPYIIQGRSKDFWPDDSDGLPEEKVKVIYVL